MEPRKLITPTTRFVICTPHVLIAPLGPTSEMRGTYVATQFYPIQSPYECSASGRAFDCMPELSEHVR